jgi:methionyl aminopeptidase
METSVCATEGCGKSGTMRCPTCVALIVTPISCSSFCSQVCFKSSWSSHKRIHAIARAAVAMAADRRAKEATAAAGYSSSDSDDESLAPRGLSKSSAARAARFNGYQYTGDLRVGHVVMPMRTIPQRIVRPDYADSPRGIPVSEEKFNGSSKNIALLDARGIAGMRKVCRLAREVLDIGVRAAKVGVTTEEIDVIVHHACVERNAYPSPLNYYGFPKSCCTSVNEVICHGIPDKRPLEDGDILDIDISIYVDGYHGVRVLEVIFLGQVYS